MPEDTKSYTYTNPAYFDGTPYEAAERAVRQAGMFAGVALKALEAADVLVRNAEMQRAVVNDENATQVALDWPSKGLGARITQLKGALGLAIKGLASAAEYAGFDPQHPPKED